MSHDVPPDAADRAVGLIGCLAQGRWEEVVGEFDDRMRERVDAGRLASGWAHMLRPASPAPSVPPDPSR